MRRSRTSRKTYRPSQFGTRKRYVAFFTEGLPTRAHVSSEGRVRFTHVLSLSRGKVAFPFYCRRNRKLDTAYVAPLTTSSLAPRYAGNGGILSVPTWASSCSVARGSLSVETKPVSDEQRQRHRPRRLFTTSLAFQAHGGRACPMNVIFFTPTCASAFRITYPLNAFPVLI